jgi:hypothetical protein
MLPSDLCYFYSCCFIYNRIPIFLLLSPPIDPRVRTLHTGLQRGRHDCSDSNQYDWSITYFASQVLRLDNN